MKKYLGSSFTAFAAIVLPLLLCFPLLFGASALCAEISATTVLLFLGCILCSVVLILYLMMVSIQLYSWGYFKSSEVTIKSFLSKPYSIQYSKCCGCGIGYYTHGILNSHVGTKVHFIYLSYEPFVEKYRSKMNLWKPSNTRIKVKFSKELYDYLISVLPKTQALMLARDYKKYITK